MKTIGERIKEIRENYFDMNQRIFSQKIGISQPALAQFENNSRTPKDIHIKRICDEFGMNEDWLRYGIGNPIRAMNEDEYTNIVVAIDKGDKKAREAIINYWNLSVADKEIFWNFFDTFIKK